VHQLPGPVDIGSGIDEKCLRHSLSLSLSRATWRDAEVPCVIIDAGTAGAQLRRVCIADVSVSDSTRSGYCRGQDTSRRQKETAWTGRPATTPWRTSIARPCSPSQHVDRRSPEEGPAYCCQAHGVRVKDHQGRDLIDCGAGLWCVKHRLRAHGNGGGREESHREPRLLSHLRRRLQRAHHPFG